MENLYSESDLDMTVVWPPVPPAMREAPAAEPGAEARGGCRRQPPYIIGLPRERADFGGINGSSSSSSSSSSDDSRTSSDNSNNNDSGDLPALVGKPARDLEVLGELSALQSERTRSHSRSLTMSASYAGALLAFATRIVEAKTTVEEEVAEIERAHDPLLKEHLEE